MKKPQTFAEVIDLWPTAEDLARDINVKGGTVRAWKRRGIIPAEYWAAVVRAGAKRGIHGIGTDLLAGLASGQRKPAKASIQVGAA